VEASAIAQRLQECLPGAVLGFTAEGIDPYVLIDPPRITEVCAFLRADSECDFDSLMCLSAVDYPPEKIQMVYHLYSIPRKHKIVLKVDLPRARPVLPTVEPVWKMANFHEREAFDLMGVVFEGHPDLRRILLPFDWEGHPLRKDYVAPESYRGVTNKA
jgi:NADH-quinone oxidoreductase subunit C